MQWMMSLIMFEMFLSLLTLTKLFILCYGSQSSSLSLNYSVFEEVPVGTIIGQIIKDSKLAIGTNGVNKCQLFDMTSHDQSKGVIQIKPESCDLFVSSRIDREQLCDKSKCILQMSTLINAQTWIKVFIEIIDINDNSPKFESTSFVVRFDENSQIGYSQELPLATDIDIGQNSVHSYTLEPQLDLFELIYTPHRALQLVLRGQIDYENKLNRYFSTRVKACDAGELQWCSKLNLNIKINDVNDNRPIFLKCNESVRIMEDTQLDRTVYQVLAKDLDEGENGRVSFEINPTPENKLSRQYFSINSINGDIYLRKSLNSIDIPDKFHLAITARDHGTIPLSSECKLIFNVIDINNRAPFIRLKPTLGNKCQIIENTIGMTTVALIMATDDDKGNNGKVNCELSNTSYFVILERWDSTSSTFKLIVKKPMDREQMSSINVSIVCRDNGIPVKSTLESISISVIDVNEYSPSLKIDPIYNIIPEDLPINSSVAKVIATDKDPDANLSLTLISDNDGFFKIDVLGNLKLMKPLDRELRPFHPLVVLVTDYSPPNSRTTSLALNITISDINDNIPKLLEPTSFHLYENLNGNSTIGQLKVSDPDSGLNGTVKFLLRQAYSTNEKLIKDTFFVNENDGTIFSLLPIDRELTSEIILRVLLTDQGSPPLSREEKIILKVADENDNEPIWTFPNDENNQYNFSISSSAIRHAARESFIVNVQASDPDSPENAKISFKLISAFKENIPVHLFTLEPTTGNLAAIGELSEGVYILKMTASDNGRPPKHSKEATLYIKVYSSNSGFFLGGETDRLSLTLIVALASVTCIICVSLLVAIIIVRRHRYSSIQYSVNVHTNDHNSLVNDSLTKWTEEQNQYIDTWNYPPHYCSYPVIPGIQKLSSIGEPLLPPPGPKDVLNSMNNSTHMCSVMHLRRPTNQDIDVSSADSGRGASEEENILNEAKNRESVRNRSKMYPTMPPISSVCACQDSLSLCGSCANNVGNQFHYQYVTYTPTSYPNYDDVDSSIQFHTSRPQNEQSNRNYHTLDTMVTATSMGSYTDVIAMDSNIQQHVPKDMSSFLGPHSNV